VVADRGAGFWKVWWDPNRGDSTEILIYKGTIPRRASRSRPSTAGALYKADQSDQLPASMGDQVQEKTIQMGDVCVDLRSPFEMFPDPLAGEEGLESAEWVIEEAVYRSEYLERTSAPTRRSSRTTPTRPGSRRAFRARGVEDGGAAGLPGREGARVLVQAGVEASARQAGGVGAGHAADGGRQPVPVAAVRDVHGHAGAGPLLAVVGDDGPDLAADGDEQA
jgi:hypothetical protein